MVMSVGQLSWCAGASARNLCNVQNDMVQNSRTIVLALS